MNKTHLFIVVLKILNFYKKWLNFIHRYVINIPFKLQPIGSSQIVCNNIG